MKGFAPRYTVELGVFILCQIILIVLALIFLRRCIKKYNISTLLSCVGCVIVFVIIIPFSWKYYLDLPYVLKGDYVSAEVTALTYNKINAPEEKAIKVKDNKTGKEFEVRFFTKEKISIGDVFEIHYLPHTNMAAIINIISCA